MLAELPLDKGSGETLPLFVHTSFRMKPVIYVMGLTISRLKTSPDTKVIFLKTRLSHPLLFAHLALDSDSS